MCYPFVLLAKWTTDPTESDDPTKRLKDSGPSSTKKEIP
jgi:hypothetical protein